MYSHQCCSNFTRSFVSARGEPSALNLNRSEKGAEARFVEAGAVLVVLPVGDNGSGLKVLRGPEPAFCGLGSGALSRKGMVC